MHQHEFKAEEPVAAPARTYKTGERVEEEGAYACLNSGTNPPPMVNLTQDAMVPVCGTCAPESRWAKI